MTYFNQFKNATRKTKRLLVLFALLFGFSANAATYKVSDNPADLANLPEGAKVVMYNIGAKRLVGYNNGEVSKTEKVTMFAEEMWFGGGEGVECGRSTGLCPLPLGVPRCVIHNKKNVGTKFLVILKKNKY